jgi:hypothetical protein
MKGPGSFISEVIETRMNELIVSQLVFLHVIEGFSQRLISHSPAYRPLVLTFDLLRFFIPTSPIYN